MNVLQNKLVWVITGLAVVIVVLLAVIIGLLSRSPSQPSDPVPASSALSSTLDTGHEDKQIESVQVDYEQEIDKFDKRIDKTFDRYESMQYSFMKLNYAQFEELGEKEADEAKKLSRQLKPSGKALCEFEEVIDEEGNVKFTKMSWNTDVYTEVEQKTISDAQKALLEKGIFLAKYEAQSVSSDINTSEDDYLDTIEIDFNNIIDKLGMLGKVEDQEIQTLYDQLIQLIDNRINKNPNTSTKERWQSFLDRAKSMRNIEEVIGYPLDVDNILSRIVPYRKRYESCISSRSTTSKEEKEAYEEYKNALETCQREIGFIGKNFRSNKQEVDKAWEDITAEKRALPSVRVQYLERAMYRH